MRFETGQSDVDAALHKVFMFTAGGHKVGVFALSASPGDGGNDRDYAPVDGEYLRAAESAIQQLESEGAELIFGLTHLYLADDKIVATLKEKHSAFMFIVGGHEHEPEFEPGDEQNAAIMKGASNARVVWQIEARFDGGKPVIETSEISVDESIDEDDEYQVIASKWRERLLSKMPFLTSSVGEAAVPQDGREVTVRNQESNWGNFIVDQMPAAFGEPVADLAFVNSGTLRIDDFVAEDITFEDIGRTFGFSSFLRHMTISGADFATLMEAGFRGEGPSKGYFPQISGFRVCIDRSRPDGQRIAQMLVPTDAGWQEIEAERDYQLVASDFLYRGGDGYDFSAAHDVSRPGSELQYLVLDAVLTAQAQGRAIGSAIDASMHRIAFLQAGQRACFN